MASRSEKQLSVIIEFIRAAGKYDVVKISEEISGLQVQLEKIAPFLNKSLSIKIDGLGDVVQLSNVLKSLNQSLPSFNGKFVTLGKTLQSLNNVDAKNLSDFQTALNKISDILSKFTIGQIKKDFTDFVEVLAKNNQEIINAIKPLQDFENAIGKLDIKIQASLTGLKQFADVALVIQQLSAGIAGNLGNVRTPVFKSKESDIASQIGQYQKLTSQIDRASDSVKRFNSAGSLKGYDQGSKDRLATDIKTITNSYNSLQTVIGKLNVELEFLTQQENADIAVINRLQTTLSEYNAVEKQHLQLLKQTEQAEIALANADRKLRDEFKQQIEGLGNIIDRQVRFVTGAAILAQSANFVRIGFKNAFDTLTEVARILVVSRSEFLNTAETAKLLGDTIDKFSTKTGSSVKEVGSILKEFGSAGLTTEQSIAALDSTLNNIIGTDSSVIETTRLVASTYNILGNTITGVSDQVANFTRINDIFARATNESSLEMDQLVEALKFSLPAAKEVGLNLEDLTAILGQLADQGLRGGNAGRALRAGFEQLAKDAPKIAKALNINIDLTKPLDFLDIIRQYGKQIKDEEINVEELGVIFSKFGLRGADTFLLLSQNADKLDKKLLDLKESSQGAAEIGANIRLEAPERQFARFSENVSRLSKEAFEPLILLLLKIVTIINHIFDVFQLLGENGFAKLSLQIGTMSFALVFLLKLLNFVSLSFTSLSVVFPVLTSGITALGAAVGGLLPWLGAIGLAIAGISAAYVYFSGNSATAKKSIDEQIIVYQQASNEANKLKNNYSDVAKQIEKTHDEFVRGNLTLDDYRNALGNIAQKSPEVADVIYNFGDNAQVASEKLKELAKSQEEVVKQQKELIGLEQLKKVNIDIGNSKDLIQGYREAAKEINKLEYKNKFPEIFKVNPDDLINAKKEIEKFRKIITENLELSIKSPNEEVKKLALDFANTLKKELGNVSFNPNVTQLSDIIDTVKKKIKDTDFDANITFDIKDLDKTINEFSKGFEGLKNKFLFDFGISDHSVEQIQKQLEEIDFTVIDSTQNFVNNLNFKGLAQTFADDFKKAGFNVTKDIQKQFQDISLLPNDNQQKFAILNIIQELAAKKKEGVKSDEELIPINEQLISLATQLSQLFGDQVRLKKAAAEATKLQAQQDITSSYEQKLVNKLLNEAKTIRRDIVEDAKFKLSIDRDQAKVQSKGYEELVKTRKAGTLDQVLETKILSQLKKKADAIKQQYQQREALRKIEFDIAKNYTEANTALENSKLIGSLLIDQDVARNAVISDQVNNLEQRYLLGENEKIILTDLLKIETERNVLKKQDLDYYIQIQKTLTATQSQWSILLSSDTKRATILASIRTIESDIRQTQEKYNSAVDGGVKFIKQQIQYEGELSKQKLDLINETIKLKGLDSQQVENARTLLGLREKIVKSYEDLTKGLVSKQEENVKNLISNLFEFKNSKEISSILRSIGIQEKDINQYLNDQGKTTEYILKNLREGKISTEGFPEPLKQALKLLEQINSVSEGIRKEQDRINTLQFNGLKEKLDKAINDGTQEGYDKAVQILSDLNSISTKFKPKTGEVDVGRTLQNFNILSDYAKKLEEINKEGLKSPSEKIINGIDIATDEFKTLGKVISDVKDELIALNNVGVLGPYAVEKRAPGGKGPGFAFGGFVPGSGSGDTVPAMLTPGEFVIPKKVVDKKGIKFFNDLIGAQGYASGGRVRKYAEGSPGGVQGSLEAGGITAKVSVTLVTDKILETLNQSKVVLESIRTNVFNTDDHLIRGLSALKEGPLTKINENIILAASASGSVDQTVDRLLKISNEKLGNLKDISNNTFGVKDVLVEIATGVNAEYAERRNLIKDVIANSNKPPEESGSKHEIEHRAFGGFVGGSGSGDIIPAMLEPGEFVIPKKIVDKKGIKFFNDLIGGSVGMKFGGMVRGYATGGPVGINPDSSGAPGSLPKIFDKLLGDTATLKLDSSINKLDGHVNELSDNISKIKIPSGGINPEGPGTPGSNSLSIASKNLLDSSDVFIKWGEKEDISRSKFDDAVEKKAKQDEAIAKIFESTGKEQLGGIKPILPPPDKATDKLLGNEELKKLVEKVAILEKEIEELKKGKAAVKTSGLSGVDTFFKTLGDRIYNYRKDIKEAGAATHTFYLEVSGAAATRLIDSIASIGDAFEQLFTQQLPNLVGFFLNDVVGSNVKIVEDYNKTKLDIAKTYKDQRASLIEQLKRNQISYLDFFDGIEDLNKRKREDDRAAALKEKKELSDNLKSNIEKAVSVTANIVGKIGTTLGDFISSIPALVSHAFSGIGDMVSKALGGLGGFGSVLGSIGGFLGPVLGSAFAGAGQLFSFIAKGFSDLIPIVSQFILMLTDDTQYQALLDTIDTLPDKLDEIVEKLKNRIPEVINALVDQGGLRKLGESFADALRAVMPQVAKAFATLVPEALLAVSPIIAAVFDSLPDFLTADFLAAFSGLPQFFIKLVIDIGNDLLGIFSTNIPRIFDIFKDSFMQAINSINLPDLATNLSASLSAGVQQAIPLISGSLQTLAPQLVSSLSVVGPQFSDSLIKEIPNIANSLVSNLAGAQGSESPIKGIIDSFVNLFLDAIPKIADRIPDIFNTILGLLSNLGNEAVTLLAGILDSLATKIPDIVQTLFISLIGIAPVLISGFVDAVTKFLTNLDVGKFSDTFGKIVSSLMEVFGKVFTEFIPQFLKSIVDSLTPEQVVGFVTALLNTFTSALGTLSGGFDFSFIIPFIQGIQELQPLIVDAVAAIQDFLHVLGDEFGKEIKSLLELLKSASIKKFVDIFLKVFNKVNEAFKNVSKVIGEVFLRIFITTLTVITDILSSLFEKSGSMKLFLNLLDKLADALDPLITLILPVLTPLIYFLVVGALLPLIVVLTPLVVLFVAVVAIVTIVNKILEVFRAVFGDVGSQLKEELLPLFTLLNEAFAVLSSTFIELNDFLTTLFAPALDKIKEAFGFLAEKLKPVTDFLIEHLTPAFIFLQAIFEKMQPYLEKIIQVLTVLTVVFFLLFTPIGPLILIIGIFIGTLVLLSETIKLFQEIMPTIIDTLTTGKDKIVQVFTDMINALIDVIPGARQAINAASGGGGSSGGGGAGAAATIGGEFTKHIPHFAEGGLVSGRSGKDKINSRLTAGEFIIRKDIVDSVGQDFLKFINSDGFLNMTRSANNEQKKGLVGALSSEINNPGTHRDNLGTASPDLFNANANSRDYYLKNYYNGNGNGANGITSPAPVTQNASRGQPTVTAPVLNDLIGSLSSKSSGASQSETQSGAVKIEINLDLRGSHFTGEDVANVVEQKLVEKLGNEQGQLARLIRDIKKDK